MKRLILICFMGTFTFGACSNNSNETFTNPNNEVIDTTSTVTITKKILSLGDSYTIGESVCETCRFPAQMKDSLENGLSDIEFTLNVIAQTGWTTTNLLNAIAQQNPDTNFDLVTLLIGVNNQYQGKPFSLYITEFPILVNKAIAAVNNNKSKVIVISIPDYAYTPFGQGSSNSATISAELDEYNNFAQTYCEANDITYVYITDITRLGLEQPELVASDGLHPSELAYSKFVERLIPIATEKLE